MLRSAAFLLAPVLLIGCAAPSPTAREEPPPMVIDLEAIAAAIAGDYVSIRQPGDTADSTRLRVDAESVAGGITLIMAQRRAETERLFELQLAAGASPDRFDARFIPRRGDRDHAGPACSMSFRLTAGRLVGETEPSTCRFGSQELEIGLLKEIAFDGERIVMADQLLLADGTPFADVDRLELGRMVHFSGSLAQRDGQSWRTSRNLRLTAGGNLIEPLDAAGMSLGLLLNLELISSSEPGVPALRLQLVDDSSGRTMAEVWNSLNAELIGLALDNVRIELRRESGALQQQP